MTNYLKITTKAKTKLIKLLESELESLSYGDIMKVLRQKDIKVNGKRTNTNLNLNIGDIVEVYYQNKEDKANFEVVYEDDNVIVYNKPSGILTVGENSLESTVQRINKNYQAEHRLDRNTAGLVIFSKNKEVSELIHSAMKSGMVEKEYLAWVYGNFTKHLVDKAYLFKDAKNSISYVSKNKTKGTQEIVTDITPIKHTVDLTLVQVKLHNGKTHQIRAHMAYLGYALVGDEKYAKREDLKKTNSKKQELFAYKINFKINKENKLSYLNNCKIVANIKEFSNKY
ncbi:MAG: RluA family pseudouridine synthase [bacterium]|nr:RluA family pseudouridine synthase [bacterium]